MTAVQQAPPAETTATPDSDAMAEHHHDLVDNDFAHFKQRKRDAVVAQKHVATLTGENAAARYRKLALCSRLVTDAEFRVLCLIVEKGDVNLKNSFPSPAWLQKNLGGSGRKLRAVYKIVAGLEAKGFLRWHREKGWQLRLPDGVLAPGADAWDGPTDWSNRWKEAGR